jgi:hypothetical protein
VNQYLAAYIRYRIEKSEQTFQDALLLAEAERWNGSINRLYYACYYIASALVLKAGLDAKTHAGVRNQLNQHYIKPVYCLWKWANCIPIYLIPGRKGITETYSILTVKPFSVLSILYAHSLRP